MVKGTRDEQLRAAARAVDAGITYFDTARSYGDGQSEESLGRVLAALKPKVVVGTKFRVEPTDANIAAAIASSLEGSLRRLGLERLDLFQLHNAIGGDRGLPVETVLGPVADALEDLRRRSLIDHLGVTAMGDTAAVTQVIQSGRYASGQVYFNALNPSAGYRGRVDAGGQDFDGLIDKAAAAGVGLINIRPLAAGALSGSAARHPNAGGAGGTMAGMAFDEDVQRAQAMAALARDLGLESSIELALRFVLAKPGVSTVIVGYSDMGHLEDAIRWAERGPLPAEGVERVLALRGHLAAH